MLVNVGRGLDVVAAGLKRKLGLKSNVHQL